MPKPYAHRIRQNTGTECQSWGEQRIVLTISRRRSNRLLSRFATGWRAMRAVAGCDDQRGTPGGYPASAPLRAVGRYGLGAAIPLSRGLLRPKEASTCCAPPAILLAGSLLRQHTRRPTVTDR